MNKTDLKPCPFCNSTNLSTGRFILCNKCNARGPQLNEAEHSVDHASIKWAIENWNKAFKEDIPVLNTNIKVYEVKDTSEILIVDETNKTPVILTKLSKMPYNIPDFLNNACIYKKDLTDIHLSKLVLLKEKENILKKLDELDSKYTDLVSSQRWSNFIKDATDKKQLEKGSCWSYKNKEIEFICIFLEKPIIENLLTSKKITVKTLSYTSNFLNETKDDLLNNSDNNFNLDYFSDISMLQKDLLSGHWTYLNNYININNFIDILTADINCFLKNILD